jgi:hypothetical protein
MRAAFSADLELTTLLLSYGADPGVVSKEGETMVEAAAGLGFIQGYSKGKSAAERLSPAHRPMSIPKLRLLQR